MCLTPYMVRNKGDPNDRTPVPCGKCPVCRKRMISGWSFRLMQEDKRSMSALFITLTYDTKHVPITDRGYMSLCKLDTQLFWKRLRKARVKASVNNSGGKISYFLCGEYGGKTWRPHYHALVFNADVRLLQGAWNKGQIHYGAVTGASIGYTLKYMSKKGKIPLHVNDDRVPEFRLMSKRLGDNYISPAMVAWHKADMYNRMYCVIEDGKKISMPRYYKGRIYDDNEREAIAYSSAIKAQSKLVETQEEFIKKYGDRWEQKYREYVQNEFRKMYKNADDNRNKI